ncbi:unnamed protein product [Enterobius vermicularis]|uniref:EGF-like domain-containing protein n=1 Tax=Enterobius vermicularis TaxID=51028 RepID=A0A0N4V171_ENTVE|nr:unnamed protein product [Enterobius vermicularis]
MKMMSLAANNAETFEDEEGCSRPCPIGDWIEGEDFCYKFLSSMNIKNYVDALSQCREYFTMIGKDDLESPETVKLLKNASKIAMVNNLIYVYAELTESYKKARAVDVISLLNSTAYKLIKLYSWPNDKKAKNVDAICKIPKYCMSPKCYFKDFQSDYARQKYIVLPPYHSLSISQEVVLPCLANRQVTTYQSYSCNIDGRFEPPLSEKVCDESTRTDLFLDLERNEFKTSCGQCYPIGTSKCVQLRPGVVKCKCKDGWKMAACWKSPQFCDEIECGNHGKCVEKVDHGICVCQSGWTGSACSINPNLLFSFGMSNDTDPLVWNFNSVQYGLLFLIAVTSLTLLIHHYYYAECDTETDYPHEMLQNHRLRMVFFGALFSFLFRHPGFFNLDSTYGARLYNFLINVFFTTGQCFYVKEATNVLRFVGGEHIDAWDKALYNNPKMKYLMIVPPCYLYGTAMVSLITALHWKNVAKPWAILGAFDEISLNFIISLAVLNFTALLAAVSTVETIFYVKKCQPYLYLTTVKFFVDKLPYELGKRLVPLDRTPPFIVLGSVLHFLTWCATTVFVLYGICIILQTLLTLSSVNKHATVLAMILLPKSSAPKYEFHDMKFRKEVLGECNSKKYKSETASEEEKLKQIKSGTRQQLELMNEGLVKKFGDLPAELRHQKPDDPPFPITPFTQFSPCNRDYIPVFYCQMLWKEMTSHYVICRTSGMSQDEALNHTKNLDFSYDDYHAEITSQRLFVWDRWFLGIKSADRLFDKISPKKVKYCLPAENDNTDVKYYKKVLKLVYKDGETTPVHKKTLLKEIENEVDRRNKPFDALYSNDLIVEHLGSKYSNVLINELLNVQPGYLCDVSSDATGNNIQANPRKRPIDEFWLDADLPGFIGPLKSTSWDTSLFSPDKRTNEFFNKILQKKWEGAVNDDVEYQTAGTYMRSEFHYS